MRVAAETFGGGLILMYHRIGPPDDVFALGVPPDQFAQQLSWIRAHCSPIGLDDFAAAMSGNCLPPRAVALTFDDGYLDNLTIAAPILHASGIPATFFVTTAGLEQPREYWWDRLARLFGASSALPDTLTLEGELAGAISVSTFNRPMAIRSLHARLRVMSVSHRDQVLGELEELLEPGAPPAWRPMTGEEVRELASYPGVAVGAHTANHLSLPAQSADVQWDELTTCRRTLEHLLGTDVRAVSYPFGEATAETIRLAVRAGFEVGVGVRQGDAIEPMCLPRTDVASLNEPLTDYLRRRFEL